MVFATTYLGVAQWNFSNSVIISILISWILLFGWIFHHQWFGYPEIEFDKKKQDTFFIFAFYLAIVGIMNWDFGDFWWSPVNCSLLFWGWRWKNISSTHYQAVDFIDLIYLNQLLSFFLIFILSHLWPRKTPSNWLVCLLDITLLVWAINFWAAV